VRIRVKVNFRFLEDVYPEYSPERHLVGEEMEEAVEVIGEIVEADMPAPEARECTPERYLVGEEMTEAVEVIGEIIEVDISAPEARDEAGEQQPRKFYAPDSSSDEELEVIFQRFFLIRR
jgi:hypothetical protein